MRRSLDWVLLYSKSFRELEPDEREELAADGRDLSEANWPEHNRTLLLWRHTCGGWSGTLWNDELLASFCELRLGVGHLLPE